jgi:hypothetical protein
MDGRQNAAQTIRQTLTKVKQFLAQEKPPKLSEADTKAVFIERYIAALGYEGLEDVVREYYVKNSQEFIDYVLRANGEPVLAIEAKPLQADLTDKHAAQLVQYCAVEGLEWCALTNARALWLFNTYLKGDQQQKLVVKLDLLGFNADEEFDTIFDQLWLLSKSSLSSPTAINSWMEQRRLDQGLRTLLLNQHSNAVHALVADLAKTTGLVASPDTVVQWVRGQLVPNLSVVPPTVVAPPQYQPKPHDPGAGPRYWLLPVGRGKDGAKALEELHRWLDKGFWGFHKGTRYRQQLQAGDYVCFYIGKPGVAATARIAGPTDLLVTSTEWPEPYPMDDEIYKIPVREIAWLPAPRPIDKAVRAKLDAFKGKNPDANPGWLVQTTNRLTAHDFDVVTTGDAA